MTTPEAPAESGLAEAAEAIHERGVVGGLKTVGRYTIQRWRHGELGALPVIIGLVVIAIYFQAQEDAFLSARNLSNIVLQISVTGTIAIGVVLVLLLGEIDLSVGAVSILCSAILASLLVNYGWEWWQAVLVMLLAGAAIGLFQGFWFAVVGVPSFVVTLAGLLMWQGVQQQVLGPLGTINVLPETFPQIDAIANSYLPNWVSWTLAIAGSALYAITNIQEQVRRRRAGLPAEPTAFVVIRTALLAAVALFVVALFNGALANVWVFGDYDRGVPTAGVIMLGLVVLFYWVTKRTKFGRYIFAVGGNAEAARRAGIKVARIRIYVFTLCATLAAVGGLIQTSRLTAASKAIDPGPVTLEAIAAAVIGGTSLFGGRGSVWSALLGALVIGSVANGLDLTGQQPQVKLIVTGAILLLAVTIDALAQRGRAAAGR
jgi:D-xylose transport system permease protein